MPIAYSHDVPQPVITPNYYRSDNIRYSAAWHAGHCTVEDCDWCNQLCEDGYIISCDDCGNVHHTDWQGWHRIIGANGGCSVYCPECLVK